MGYLGPLPGFLGQVYRDAAVLRTRITLLNSFIGGGILWASILPVVFLFQAAPRPHDLPRIVVYLWLLLWPVQWGLQLALPMAITSSWRLRISLGAAALLASLSLVGAANIDNRASWRVLNNGIFWLLATTYISTLGVTVALVFLALQHMSGSKYKGKGPSSEPPSPRAPLVNEKHTLADACYAGAGCLCFAIALYITGQVCATPG